MSRTPPPAPLRCPRCNRAGDPFDLSFYRGCPHCERDGVPVGYVCDVPADRVTAALSHAAHRPGGAAGLWRWGDALPVRPAPDALLPAGDTPLIALPRLGAATGLPRLWAKNETVNLTWSHKDRLCALVVAAARSTGAGTVTAASTGNHGAALAAYAARAGLRCVIFTMDSVPETMKTLMLSYGAEVVAVRRGEDRYPLMARAVTEQGWYPGSNGVTPPVGSPSYGVDGYKTIAYELFEQLGGAVPDVVALPVTYGDCLAGIARGFADLRRAGLSDRLPRLVGAEIFGALGRGLAGDDAPVPQRPTAAFSIATVRTTYQAVRAMRACAGETVTVAEDAMLAAQRELARTEGLFVEASSAVPVAALLELARAGRIGADATVVCLLTSSGLKDPAAGRALLPDVPVVEPIA